MSQGWRPNPRFWDRVARVVITTGGITLVAAVLAILIFIVREAAPLAGRAKVVAERSLPTSDRAILAGTDNYREIGFRVLATETQFFRLQDGATLRQVPAPFDSTAQIQSAAHSPVSGLLVLGSTDGRVAVAKVEDEATWEQAGRRVDVDLRLAGIVALDSEKRPVMHVVGDRDEDGAMAVAGIFAPASAPDAVAVLYAFAGAEGEHATTVQLADGLEGKQPTALMLSFAAGLLAVGTSDGTLYFWSLEDPENPVLEDHVNADSAAITALQMLVADQSLLVGGARGEVSVWFRVRYARVTNSGTRAWAVDGVEIGPKASHVFLDQNLGQRLAHLPDLRVETEGHPWTRIRSFHAHDAAVISIAPSPRVKGFASLDATGRLVLQQSTSDRTLVVLETGLENVTNLAFAPRGDGLVALDASNRLHAWRVDNPHPEVGLQALLGKVWYEGYAAPEFVWQSTGGSEDFEPKLSLVPLFAGTLKGTLYAMLFSVPLAILGALYLSQLASPALRNLVKPAVEMMSAVPSVVVGFLAALWLAPLLEANLTAWGTVALLLPVGLAAALGAWLLLPRTWRMAAPVGTELLFMLPFLVGAAWLGSALGPFVERVLFAGDLRQWLYGTQGIHYDQRNCVVVGMALGVAVIPIVFSICEDAMSSVPRSLTSAALALGASRWQTALHVILPAASPGIFAAVMLGLGRAIGETMIVLMATGNTPILDFSPFNGMRTMSAAIAVEIPEAPQGGTLYRVLFLTGALLFVFTFLINTGADLIARHLRKRYAQF